MWRCACAVALLCAALADADSFKRAEMSASPFVLSSRYGRSSPRMLSPRNDRFFLTGRYGKRSQADVERRERLAAFAGAQSDRDGDTEGVQSERDRDSPHQWRPRCDCAPYVKETVGTYYKRTPETMDTSSEED